MNQHPPPPIPDAQLVPEDYLAALQALAAEMEAHQAGVERRAKRRKPSPIHLGITNDQLLKLRGRSKADQLRSPDVRGQDDNGLIFDIYYADCTVRVRKPKAEGAYRVVGVGAAEVVE